MENNKFLNIINLDSTPSTNTFLKSQLADFPDGTVVFALNQTQGRGKFARKWYGEAGCSSFCSFLVKNIQNPYDAMRLNFKFSLVVKQLLMKYTDADNLILKWPNDLLVKPNKKICGILSEYIQNCVITGIGINIKHFVTPENISDISFLEDLSDEKIDLKLFNQQLVVQANEFFNQNEHLPASAFPDIWFKEAAIRNKKIDIVNNNLIITGLISGITDYGALIIKANTGTTEIITTGDITYHD